MKVKCVILLFAVIALLSNLEGEAQSSERVKNLAPMLSLLLSDKSATMEEKVPSLSLMVAMDTDTIEMAWIPGSDGITPVEQIQYDIHLSTSEDFTPGPDNLKKTVTGVNQAEITGLATDTLYYGKVVAIYTASSSDPSNTLQTKTYKYSVLQDSSTTVAIAADLGLGEHTTSDGATYTYSGGTPPEPGSVLFSEDIAGGMTLRTVDAASSFGGTVTVYTSDASLTDVLDRASIYSSFQLFDVASQAEGLPTNNNKIATARSFADRGGSRHHRMKWKNGLLVAEQVNHAYHEEDFSVEPNGSQALIRLMRPGAVKESFTASVTAEFEPKLITEAEWGGIIFKQLDSAKVAAQGTLSLTALAQYDFSASGSVSKEFQLFKRTWTALYQAGPVPVYQEITLSLDVNASASAQAEVQAMAKAQLSEIVEVGAIYNGSSWSPYITHSESDSLAASLDIVGKANAEIRVIPKIEVEFYTVVNSSLTVEPFAQSSLTFEETTNNVDFLAANPEHLIQLTTFDASLGLESNLSVTLSALDLSWNVLPATCVLGTGSSCSYNFSPLSLFSIPKLELSSTNSTETKTDLRLRITDGTYNDFSRESVKWEVFPSDATVTPGSCSKSGTVTTCTATFTPGAEDKYTVFASGYGQLGELARQFEEIELPETTDCTYSKIVYDEQYAYSATCHYSEMTFYFEETNFWISVSYYDKDVFKGSAIFYFQQPPGTNYVQYDQTTYCDSEGHEYECWFASNLDGCHASECPNQGGRSSVVLYRDWRDYYNETILKSWCLSCGSNTEEANGYMQSCSDEVFSMIPVEISAYLYKGSCHEWWDHEDNGSWVSCVD